MTQSRASPRASTPVQTKKKQKRLLILQQALAAKSSLDGSTVLPQTPLHGEPKISPSRKLLKQERAAQDKLQRQRESRTVNTLLCLLLFCTAAIFLNLIQSSHDDEAALRDLGSYQEPVSSLPMPHVWNLTSIREASVSQPATSSESATTEASKPVIINASQSKELLDNDTSGKDNNKETFQWKSLLIPQIMLRRADDSQHEKTAGN